MHNVKTWNSGLTVEMVDLLIEKRSEGVTKKGAPFLRLTLRDKSGSIPGVLWDFDPDRHTFKEGQAVRISGTVSSFNDQLQITIQSIAESMVDPLKFAKSTEFDVEAMFRDLVNIVDSFREPLTKFVAEELLIKQAAIAQAYKKSPAAKTVHNAWFGGLLEHVHSLVHMAEPIIDHYRSKYFNTLSREKVLFGLMMHDAGKIIEYDIDNPAFPVSTLGQFTNHIILGPAWVAEMANRWWKERGGPEKDGDLWTTELFKIERAHLMHILAAHHGRLEWGSPVVPASLEAILVHHLDNMDAKMMHALDFVKGEPGSTPKFSQRSYFEGTSFYQPSMEDYLSIRKSVLSP